MLNIPGNHDNPATGVFSDGIDHPASFKRIFLLFLWFSDDISIKKNFETSHPHFLVGIEVT